MGSMHGKCNARVGGETLKMKNRRVDDRKNYDDTRGRIYCAATTNEYYCGFDRNTRTYFKHMAEQLNDLIGSVQYDE